MYYDQITAAIARPNALKSKPSSGDLPARNESLQLSLMAPPITVAARISIDRGLFMLITDPITSNKLALLSRGEKSFIPRLLRPLNSISFADEVGDNTWKPTPIIRVMAVDGIAVGHRKANKYFQEAGYRCPVDPGDGFMQYAHQSKLPGFQIFRLFPGFAEDVNLLMGNTMGARVFWAHWLPVEEQPFEGSNTTEEKSPLVVDVGCRSYFYHHILHEWLDGKAPTFYSMPDMAVVAFNSGMERTAAQWKQLLEAAGLTVVKIWLQPQDDGYDIVEAMLQG
ncbi:putative O-methyltransferase [Daldinia bambusicola]|nr:putative O-methyltransferase [Daldinia bambusicola]